jgi:hypothetical protein
MTDPTGPRLSQIPPRAALTPAKPLPLPPPAAELDPHIALQLAAGLQPLALVIRPPSTFSLLRNAFASGRERSPTVFPPIATRTAFGVRVGVLPDRGGRDGPRNSGYPARRNPVSPVGAAITNPDRPGGRKVGPP